MKHAGTALRDRRIARALKRAEAAVKRPKAPSAAELVRQKRVELAKAK